MLTSTEELKAEIANRPDYKNLNETEWETKIVSHQINTKFAYVLDHAIECRLPKIKWIRYLLDTDSFFVRDGLTIAEFLLVKGQTRARYRTKLDLLFDQVGACLKEKQLRKKNLVTRNPHNTDYYIDFVNGSDARTGLNPDETGDGSWETVNKYTAAVRGAGDRAFIRANMTSTLSADITFTDDGDGEAFLEIIGCDSVVNDPWVDSSDVKPIFDFDNGSFQVNFSADHFWKFTRIDIRQSADPAGAVVLSTVERCVFVDSVFRDGFASNVEGVVANNGAEGAFYGCSWVDCFGSSLSVNSCGIYLENCTFDAGSDVGSSNGIRVSSGGTVDAIDCSIAPANAFGTAEVHSTQASVFRGRNIIFGVSQTTTTSRGGSIGLEDEDGTFESHEFITDVGVITRDVGTVRSGGGDTSAKFVPEAGCGPAKPMVLGNKLSGFAAIKATASVEITVSVYASPGSAWDSPLTAAECYMKASYLSNGASSARTVVQSAETIANDAPGSGWTALTVTFTPARTGLVYVWFYLEEFEDATEHVFVDVVPVVS